MVVSPLWREPGNIHGFVLDGNPTDKDRLLLKYQLCPPFLGCEDNNVDVTDMQPIRVK